MNGLTYKDAGVDIEAGERLIDRIKPLAARTRTPEVLSGLGGFAGLCGLPSDIEEPVLVSGTDGVGTKLKVAFAADRHATVGIDLVAMCVNDILTCGARPLFFLDYFATGNLDVDRATQVVEGIATGCELAGCALLGGETAELPGFYQEGEYDLAGFAVGVVDRKAILDGSSVKVGDALIGLPSSGLHSNGYSLARRALLDAQGGPEGGSLQLDAQPPGLEGSLADALLAPTRIYAKGCRAALATGAVHAMSHITGGGLPGNLPRVLPQGCAAQIDAAAWARPPIFDLIQSRGGIAEGEMRRTFNLGVGMVFVVDSARAAQVITALEDAGESPFTMGVLTGAASPEATPIVLYAGDDEAG